MRKLEKEEMLNVSGGAGITASFVTALVRGVNSFLDVGRSIGSSIRRIFERNVCPLD